MAIIMIECGAFSGLPIDTDWFLLGEDPVPSLVSPTVSCRAIILPSLEVR